MDSLLEQIKLFIGFKGIEAGVKWETKRENLFNELRGLLTKEEPAVIVLDEVGVYLSNLLADPAAGRPRVESFLNWLRSLRQDELGNIRWIMCSSVSIENFVSLHALSHTINDLDLFSLDALNEPEARGLFKALGASDKIEFKEEHLDYMLDKLAWPLPYYMQLLYSKVKYLSRDKPISTTLIDEAYDKLIPGPNFNTWVERLNGYPHHKKYIKIVLKTACQERHGCTREVMENLLQPYFQSAEDSQEMVSEILRILKNDGYLHNDKTGKYYFRSPLLRDFWYNQFVL